nr:hypothetical protein GCM10020092_104060 [Actinoplanes digitatis]
MIWWNGTTSMRAERILCRPEAEQQVGRGAVAGNGDGRAGQVAARHPAVAAGQHQRAAAAAQRAAAGQQVVVVEEPGQGGIADLDQVELAANGRGVRHVDVRERQPHRLGAGDETVHEGVEDEGVVGAGRNRQRKRHALTVTTLAPRHPQRTVSASPHLARPTVVVHRVIHRQPGPPR